MEPFAASRCRMSSYGKCLGQWKNMAKGYHRGTIEAVLEEYRRHTQLDSVVPPPELPVKYWFEEDIAAGMTFCFDELVVVKEPNLQHRKLTLQTRSSMSTAGVARGFGAREVRYAFRRAVLSHLRLPPPSRACRPSPTCLGFGVKDAKLHGRAWQLRCHIKPSTFEGCRPTSSRNRAIEWFVRSSRKLPMHTRPK